jgi:hypothetical protein
MSMAGLSDLVRDVLSSSSSMNLNRAVKPSVCGRIRVSWPLRSDAMAVPMRALPSRNRPHSAKAL